MCDEYTDDVQLSCMDCHDKQADDIEKCMKDKPREHCDKQSIRVYKKCIGEGVKAEKKCSALSGRVFFDCYQY